MSGPLDERLMDVYHRLLARYGPQSWWPGDSAFEVIVGPSSRSPPRGLAWRAQSTTSRPQAFCRRLPCAPSPSRSWPCSSARRSTSTPSRASSGPSWSTLANAMTTTWMRCSNRTSMRCEGSCSPSTASARRRPTDILLYAAGKPVFVIDAYTRRIMGRLGITPPVDRYEAYQSLFMDSLPRDTALFNEYHALLTGTAWRPAASGRRCVSRAACWTCARRARRRSQACGAVVKVVDYSSRWGGRRCSYARCHSWRC